MDDRELLLRRESKMNGIPLSNALLTKIHVPLQVVRAIHRGYSSVKYVWFEP